MKPPRTAVPLPDAARQLGRQQATLRIQIAKGVLKAHKQGRDWYIEPEEIERYRREHLRGESVA